VTDKTEAPTPRRLRRAREDGDSGASGYAAQAVAFAAAVALAPAFVASIADGVSGFVSIALARAAHPGGPLECDAPGLVTRAGLPVVPMLLAVGVVGGVFQLVQTGGVVSAKRLSPDIARLDPIAGLRGLFGATRLWSIARALVAGVLVGWLAYRGLVSRLPDLAHVSGRLAPAGTLAGVAGRTLAWQVAILGLAFGALDLVVTRRAWLERLKMTKVEVQREHKDAEGDPHLKAARTRAYQELLAQATLANVRQASVVVVNPTHLACALRYEAKEGDEAPVVVASGEGDFAARIVSAAREAGVPIVRDVPLARALAELEVGVAIPEALYQAVAEILREVWEDGSP
jgi:flagellar biosynthetic protein FlhB